MGSCLDLRKYQDSSAVLDAYSKVVSGGKYGYRSVIERKQILPKCVQCGRGGDNGQKFCPQCGGKMAVPLTHCPGCKKSVEDSEKFCTDCGMNLDALRLKSVPAPAPVSVPVPVVH